MAPRDDVLIAAGPAEPIAAGVGDSLVRVRNRGSGCALIQATGAAMPRAGEQACADAAEFQSRAGNLPDEAEDVPGASGASRLWACAHGGSAILPVSHA